MENTRSVEEIKCYKYFVPEKKNAEGRNKIKGKDQSNQINNYIKGK